ncbi:TFIIA-domain-containing protein [Jaminaea rosea]|uniref:Transcription initiation factor IIA large subunit n=1 Tax=Jaminaea rosea TaxID=1569628 RepID=A0A316UZV1_9BASI|nr:TFIIA-domain-containing protein [Jaminaea rosea]PWN30829.1 TFIIA-domain-containing protein [Jaminaea rosea]
MSNKVVSGTYRAVIDDVIANVRQDFEEMGIEKEVLEELQRSWEARLVATGVTDFEGAPVVPRQSRKQQQKDQPSGSGSGGDAAADNKDGIVKKEGADGEPSAEPSASTSTSNKAARTDGSSDAASGSRSGEANGAEERDANGAGGAEGEEAGPSASQASRAGEKRKQPESNSDEIGSDLDDSDEEAEGEAGLEGHDGDTVLCLYEKVNRVRNRWKCVLRDGVANIDGRDYLFTRCNT